MGRAHEGACTRFPYLLIESDSVDLDTWFKILVTQPIPIASICTSGSKSLHTLIRLDDTADWQTECSKYHYLVDYGADKNAMTKVRRTRLPGVVRREKIGMPCNCCQQLLYLDPNAGRLEGQCTTILERLQTLSNPHN